MSRIGNCLDNREVEHWFGIFKSEFYNLINPKDWTLKELEIKIANYIKYYNEQRIQKQLNWMSPIQYQNALKSAIIK